MNSSAEIHLYVIRLKYFRPFPCLTDMSGYHDFTVAVLKYLSLRKKKKKQMKYNGDEDAERQFKARFDNHK